MFKSNSLKKCVLSFIVLHCCSLQMTYAHEGHGHSHESVITIGKKTYIHLQSVLLAYQYIYGYVVKGETEGIAGPAQNIINAAAQGIETEPEGAGQHMMEHILEAAQNLKEAASVQQLQKAFTALDDALFPFFNSWPNQLIRNRLKICQCKNGHRWIQPGNTVTTCPYSQNKSSDCLIIVETKY